MGAALCAFYRDRALLQGGDFSDDELLAALEPAWERHGVAVVQEPIPTPDLRLDFLDGEYLLGYERAPIRVVGDGHAPSRAPVAARTA